MALGVPFQHCSATKLDLAQAGSGACDKPGKLRLIFGAGLSVNRLQMASDGVLRQAEDRRRFRDAATFDHCGHHSQFTRGQVIGSRHGHRIKPKVEADAADKDRSDRATATADLRTRATGQRKDAGQVSVAGIAAEW
jgi:hypothetical protein